MTTSLQTDKKHPLNIFDYHLHLLIPSNPLHKQRGKYRPNPTNPEVELQRREDIAAKIETLWADPKYFKEREEVKARAVKLIYRNYRGETQKRHIIPVGTYFSHGNQWHPEPQYLIIVLDTDRGVIREFALKDCDYLCMDNPN